MGNKFLCMNLKKIIPIILIILFIAFYVGYSFSERGNIRYTSIHPENVDVTPDLNNYSPGQRVKVEFTTTSKDRKTSLFRPLLKSELVVSTDLRNPDGYIVINNNKNRIKPSKIKTEKYNGVEYKILHFNLPLKEGKKVSVLLDGEIPNLNEATFAHIVQRNYYIFGSKDYYKNTIKRTVKR